MRTRESPDSLLTRAGWSAYVAMRAPREGRFPFRSPGAVRKAQRRRLRDTVSHAYEHVPYYRETMRRVGLRPADIRAAEDLSKLPLLEPDQLRRDPEYFLSSARAAANCVEFETGGTSGVPRRVFHDPFALFQGAVYHERVRAVIRELAGARFRTRDLRFTSPAGVVSTASRALNARSLIPPSLRADRRDVPFFASPADAVVAINDFRPEVLSATYGSYLEELFVHVHRSGETLHQPAVVTYGGDSLSDPVRRLIMEHYGIPVVSVYGAVEAFDIGFECERHLGHHLNLDLYPLRVVDAEGRELPDGRSGNVVVSSLVGRGTVILNYRLGDIAAKLPIDCPCGRSLPLLSFIEGREDDSLRSANGESIDSRAVRTLFKGEEQIARYRVVQEAPTQVAVFLVTLEASKPEGLVHRLACKLQDRFGARTRIEISVVDSFPRTRRGKVRTIESLL